MFYLVLNNSQNKRHISSTRIYSCYYHIMWNMSSISSIEAGYASFIRRDSKRCTVHDALLNLLRPESQDVRGSSVMTEHGRRAVRQTNSERKRRLNVLGMWQTVGEGALAPAHMQLGGFQVSRPPPPFTYGCQGFLKETRLVLSRKSHKRRRRRGICICKGV